MKSKFKILRLSNKKAGEKTPPAIDTDLTKHLV